MFVSLIFLYVQVSVLDQAASIHPDSSWWIKADGVDVLPGLGESMRMEWSGDVDLNDGSLQRQYDAYIQRLDFINGLGLRERSSAHQILLDLQTLHQDLCSDLSCIDKCKCLIDCV